MTAPFVDVIVVVATAKKMDDTGLLVYVCAGNTSKSSRKFTVTGEPVWIWVFGFVKLKVITLSTDDAPAVAVLV